MCFAELHERCSTCYEHAQACRVIQHVLRCLLALCWRKTWLVVQRLPFCPDVGSQARTGSITLLWNVADIMLCWEILSWACWDKSTGCQCAFVMFPKQLWSEWINLDFTRIPQSIAQLRAVISQRFNNRVIWLMRFFSYQRHYVMRLTRKSPLCDHNRTVYWRESHPPDQNTAAEH